MYVWEAEVITAKAAEPWHRASTPWSWVELGSDPDSAAYQPGFPDPQFP